MCMLEGCSSLFFVTSLCSRLPKGSGRRPICFVRSIQSTAGKPDPVSYTHLPLADGDPKAISDNDHSIVLRIVYGSRSFLFTGDIERSAEAEMTSLGGTLSADLVKVPHHGSRTSSTSNLIEAIGAEYAVISVGRSSPFVHPHPDVVERWQIAGAKVLTTGEKGMISVSTNGSDLSLSTFVP